jgi:hypothetical protein
MTPKAKLLSLQDIHDAEYFERLQTRKEDAISEFMVVQKAIQREKIKGSEMFNN